jgi:DNA polymerase-3 subunit epsilon
MFGIFNKQKKTAIDESMLISDVRFVVVDTELTGLDEKKDSIVSIGAVRMVGGTINLGDLFYRLVSPKAELKADSVCIHEITPSDVAEQPGIEAAFDEFLEYAGNDVLVGHFISIDLSFLNREMKRLHGRELPNPVLDTFSIYEWLRKRQRARDCFATPFAGYRLYDIVKCFDISVHGAHNAIMDAFATAQLFQRFIPYLAEAGAQDIGGLLKIGTPFEGGDRFTISGEFGNF